MPEYRRRTAPGGTFFFTLVTFERRPLLGSAATVDLLRSAMASVRVERPFAVLGAIVMLDHVHCLWELPPDDTDYSTRVGLIKARFTRLLLGCSAPCGPVSPSRRRHRERAVWQRRFWEHTIRNENDFAAHLDYIHYNPVKHGVAACPHAWPYSSFHHWVRAGAYPVDWCCACNGRTPTPPAFDQIATTIAE